MLPFVRAVAPAACLVFLAATCAAQEPDAGHLLRLSQIRADEIIDDTARNLLVARGNIEFPDGAKIQDGEIVCDRGNGTLAVIDRAARTYDLYSVGAATCVAWTEALRRSNRLR